MSGPSRVAGSPAHKSASGPIDYPPPNDKAEATVAGQLQKLVSPNGNGPLNAGDSFSLIDQNTNTTKKFKVDDAVCVAQPKPALIVVRLQIKTSMSEHERGQVYAMANHELGVALHRANIDPRYGRVIITAQALQKP